MVTTAKDCAALCAASYGAPAAAGVTWDHLDDGSADDGVWWALKLLAPDLAAAVLRGSDDPMDWLRDVFAVPKPWGAPRLGPVHWGFYIGMPQVAAELRALLARTPGVRRLIITGHSLAAGRGKILAGELTDSPPAELTALVRFGSPRPGYAQLGRLVGAAVEANLSFCNADARGVDDVTTVPYRVAPLGLLYEDDPPTDLPAAAIGDDFFRLHHVSIYAATTPAIPVA